MTSPTGDEPASSGPPDQPYQPSSGQPYQPSSGQPYQPSAGQPYQPSSGQPGQSPAGQPYQPQPYAYPQAPPYAQPYGAPPRLRGSTPLWLALIFGVVGIALLVVGAVVGVTQGLQKVNNFSRVSIAAGRGTANFPSAGNYLAYYEASDVTSSIRQVPLPLVEIRSPSGHVQRLDTLYGGASRESLQIKSFLTYQYNGHNGVAIYQFHITEPGRYDVLVQATGNEAPGADIAFGKSIGKGLAVGGVLLIVGLLLILVAIILLIVGLVQRSRSRKRLAAAQGYGGPPPSGYGYPPAQGNWPPPQQR